MHACLQRVLLMFAHGMETLGNVNDRKIRCINKHTQRHARYLAVSKPMAPLTMAKTQPKKKSIERKTKSRHMRAMMEIEATSWLAHSTSWSSQSNENTIEIHSFRYINYPLLTIMFKCSRHLVCTNTRKLPYATPPLLLSLSRHNIVFLSNSFHSNGS